jgi:hypothetical protein
VRFVKLKFKGIMKKKLFSIVLSFVFISGIACNGDMYLAASQEDFDSIVTDFENNCCKNSSIVVMNVNTGATVTLTLHQNGPNSSCSIGIA